MNEENANWRPMETWKRWGVALLLILLIALAIAMIFGAVEGLYGSKVREDGIYTMNQKLRLVELEWNGEPCTLKAVSMEEQGSVWMNRLFPHIAYAEAEIAVMRNGEELQRFHCPAVLQWNRGNPYLRNVSFSVNSNWLLNCLSQMALSLSGDTSSPVSMTYDMDSIRFDENCCIINPGDGYFHYETEELRFDVKLRVNANNVKLVLTTS